MFCFLQLLRVNVLCSMYFRKIADVSILYTIFHFFDLIWKMDSISLMPIFMFLLQFLEILQGGVVAELPRPQLHHIYPGPDRVNVRHSDIIITIDRHTKYTLPL